MWQSVLQSTPLLCTLVYANDAVAAIVAQFVLSREVVRKFGMPHYASLRAELNHSASPVETHLFERAWFYVFGLHMPQAVDICSIVHRYRTMPPCAEL